MGKGTNGGVLEFDFEFLTKKKVNTGKNRRKRESGEVGRFGQL